jgi:hypothetical protein
MLRLVARNPYVWPRFSCPPLLAERSLWRQSVNIDVYSKFTRWAISEFRGNQQEELAQLNSTQSVNIDVCGDEVVQKTACCPSKITVILWALAWSMCRWWSHCSHMSGLSMALWWRQWIARARVRRKGTLNSSVYICSIAFSPDH